MIGMYRPGDSPLHRARAGAKLLALLAFGVAVAWRPTLVTVAVACLMVVTGYLAAHFTPQVLLQQVWPLRWWVLAIAVFQWWGRGPAAATVVTGTLLASVAAATLVTLTTPLQTLLAATVRALGPLRRVGVNPERVGLVLMLTLRTVPVITELAAQSTQARRARGLERSPRALLTPLVIRTVRRADQLGEALAARGLDD